jgi:hypothetical protein
MVLNPNNPILEVPIHIGTLDMSLNTKTLEVLEQVKLASENNLINNIKHQTSYYNFISENIYYIIQIIYDIFS